MITAHSAFCLARGRPYFQIHSILLLDLSAAVVDHTILHDTVKTRKLVWALKAKSSSGLSQFVRTGSTLSQLVIVHLSCEAPQGSIFGLFLVNIFYVLRQPHIL